MRWIWPPAVWPSGRASAAGRRGGSSMIRRGDGAAIQEAQAVLVARGAGGRHPTRHGPDGASTSAARGRDTATPGQRRMLLYAPLYVSSECVNYCTYCGFRYPQQIVRQAPERGRSGRAGADPAAAAAFGTS